MSLMDIVDSMEKSFSFHKDVIIKGFKFEITLLSYEEEQIVSQYNNEDEEEDPLKYYERTRMNILSHAIRGISDEKIPDIIEVKEGEKIITKERPVYVRDLLKRIPPKIFDKLFDIYIDFKEEKDNELDSEIEYKWYKTPEQREVEKKQEEKERELKDKSKEKETEEEPIIFKKVEEKDEEENK